jgi:hypothetical protein
MPKGGQAENEFSKELSLLWSNGEKKDLCRRNRELADPSYQGGDLTFRKLEIKPLYDSWNIECKTGYSRKATKKKEDGQVVRERVVNWGALDLLDTKQSNPTLIKMWQQCVRDADLTHREPVLIFRRNNREACIVFRNEYFNTMSEYFSDFPAAWVSLAYAGVEVLKIVAFKDFKEWVSGRFASFFGGQC